MRVSPLAWPLTGWTRNNCRADMANHFDVTNKFNLRVDA
eukprot:COSAG01_NODE_60137_length_296_cov_0.791878_2_plen_38_part_01